MSTLLVGIILHLSRRITTRIHGSCSIHQPLAVVCRPSGHPNDQVTKLLEVWDMHAHKHSVLMEIVEQLAADGPVDWQPCCFPIAGCFGGAKLEPSNYRTLNVIFFSCKMLALVWLMAEKRWVSTNQRGFRYARSFPGNFLSTCESWLRTTNENEFVDKLDFQFKQTLDRVPHAAEIYYPIHNYPQVGLHFHWNT